MHLRALTLDQMMVTWGHEFAEVPEPYRAQILARAQSSPDLFGSGVYGGDYGFKPHPTFGNRTVWRTLINGQDSLVVANTDLATYLNSQTGGFYPGQYADGAPTDAYEEVVVVNDETGNRYYYTRIKPSVAAQYDLEDAGSETGDRYHLRLREPNNWSWLAAQDKLQVTRNPWNRSWLSIGAQGGYRDPRLLTYDSRYGVITPRSNYLEQSDTFWEVWGGVLTVFAAAAAGAAAAGAAGGSATAATAAEGIGGVGGSGLTAAEMAALEAQAAAEIATGGISATSAAGYAVTTSAVESGLATQAALSAGESIGGATPSGYEPSPPPGSSMATNTSTATSGGAGSSTISDVGVTSSGGAGSGVTASQIAKGASLVKSIIGATSGGAPKSSGSAFAPLVRTSAAPPDWYSASDAGLYDTNIAVTEKEPFNWWWLVLAGAAGYVASRKRKGAKS